MTRNVADFKAAGVPLVNPWGAWAPGAAPFSPLAPVNRPQCVVK